MSRDWTPEEIQTASAVMKAAGHMGYEEFCEELNRKGFAVTPSIDPTGQLQPEVSSEDE